MKNLSEYITEAGFKPVKKVQPKTTRELKEIIYATIKLQGYNANLNFIDTSKITDMSMLFNGSPFNGDITEWDVSNVTDMSYMFHGSNFNGDIHKWNVSNVVDMEWMFKESNFNQDISDWPVDNVKNHKSMFLGCDIKKQYKPKF